jgi:hypothetical protein
MSSLLQYCSLARARPASRPVLAGALSCGVLLLSAGTAQANHRMADGTLCPHAAGTPVPGETAPPPGPERAASTSPIGAAPAAAPRPAVRPGTKAPAERPAAQAQAQRPASSQAQAQRPATAAQPVATQTMTAAPVARQAPVARPSAAKQPRAKSARRAAPRPVVEPVTPNVVRPVATERPAAYATAAAPEAGTGTSVPAALVASLFVLGVILVAGVFALCSRVGRRPAPVEDAVEAELQAMIREVKARAVRASADPDGREVVETR